MVRLIVFLLLLSTAAAAQVTLHGRVVDERGSGVLFASIAVKGTVQGTSADDLGNYTMELDPGSYTIVITSIGYTSYSKQIDLSANMVLDVTLADGALGLEEVVVTGTMKPVFVSQSPIKVDVVTSKHLEMYLPAASSSILESIALVNGVQEVVACGVCFTNSISINGLPGPYTAVLMDGTPIYGNLASVYGLNGIPNMIIDRFEVIKGPNSTLYGSEAVAGVINIITKDPAKQPVAEIDVMGTSQAELFGNVAIAPRIGNSSGYIGLNYAMLSQYEDRNNDGFGDGANLDRYSLFTKWNIGRRSGKPFTIAAKYYYEDRRNGVEAFVRDRNYKWLRGDTSVYGESIYTRRAEVFGSYVLSTNQSLKIDYSASMHDQDSYYGSDHYVADQKIAFANLIYNKPLANHDLLLGITNRYQYYNDNTVATSDSLATGEWVDMADNQYIPGMFIQDEWTPSDKTSLLMGLRMDHYSHHGLIWSPRLNLKYKAGTWTTARLNLGTGFRVVNLFTEDHAFVTGQRTIEITEDLKPEESYNASANLNHVFTWGSSQGMIDVDAFYTYFTNKIIPNYDVPGKIVYANTEGYAQTKGVGINFSQEFRIPFTFNAGLTLMETTETETDNQGVASTRRVEFAPRMSAVFTANYQMKKLGMSIGYTMNLTGRMALPEVYDLDDEGNPLLTPRSTESEPFSIHNIQVSKSLKGNFSLYGGIQNIFDYIQPISPLTGYNDPTANPGFSSYFDTAYAFAPIHGREFYLGVKWSLARKAR